MVDKCRCSRVTIRTSQDGKDASLLSDNLPSSLETGAYSLEHGWYDP